jgi:CRISPR-associated endoribonuclease Cas6
VFVVVGDYPDLYALVLRMRPQDGQALPEVRGQGLHGLFMELVRQADPERSHLLHAEALSKHFTVAALSRDGGGDRRRRRRVLEMRVTLLEQELFQPVTRALLEQSVRPAMRLGVVPLVLDEVCGTREHDAWSGFGRFVDVAGQVVPVGEVMLEFASPTFMRQGTMPGGNKQRLNVLPLPEAVFGSLARRWNDLAPAEVRVPGREEIRAMCEEVLVAQYQVETVAHRLRSQVQIGFVGWCRYLLPDDGEVRRVLTLLADAAFYLGVGAKTTQGMGLCRRVVV